MRHMAVAVFLALSVVLAASTLAPAARARICPDEPDRSAEKPAPAFSRILFTDTGGIQGKGSGKWLEVLPDGTFHARRPGVAEVAGKLPPEELAELSKRVAAVDWGAVQEFYQGGADTYYDVLTLTIGDKAYKTSADEYSKPPAALRSLLDCLNALYARYVVRKGK